MGSRATLKAIALDNTLLFLVAELAAIAPMYGPQSLPFAALECGYLSQLLMLHAPSCGLGLCPIGGVEFDRVRHLFALGDTQVMLHSHLGGIPAGDGERATLPVDPGLPRELLEGDREEGEI